MDNYPFSTRQKHHELNKNQANIFVMVSEDRVHTDYPTQIPSPFPDFSLAQLAIHLLQLSIWYCFIWGIVFKYLT